MSAPAAFVKMYAASDMQLILGVPAKPPALWRKEEQRRERALIFVKKIGASDTKLAPTCLIHMKKIFLAFQRLELNSRNSQKVGSDSEPS